MTNRGTWRQPDLSGAGDEAGRPATRAQLWCVRFWYRCGGGGLVLAAALVGAAAAGAAGEQRASGEARPSLLVCADETNDLWQALRRSGIRASRYGSVVAALQAAPTGSSVFLLADGYPSRQTTVPDGLLTSARERRLRVFVEYPASLPGLRFGAAQPTNWERLVVSTDRLGPRLPSGRILGLPDARILPVQPAPSSSWLVSARVAGFDQAVYGIPANALPVLFPAGEGDLLVATTALSRMTRNRYAPQWEWEELWNRLLAWAQPGTSLPRLAWKAEVRPALSASASLPQDVESQALRRGVRWVHRSRLLVPGTEVERLHTLLRQGKETDEPLDPSRPGDGSHGILEGYASGIRHDGSQPVRIPLRADCQAESAMVLAAGWHSTREGRDRRVSGNLLRYLYETSGMHGGIRADPTHPAYGLIAWGTVAPAWEVASYGDDQARVLLASAAASVWLDDRRWDEAMLRALVANLRTTGRRGFRGDRIDFPELARRGWKSYRSAETVNLSPFFEAYLWACYLWAYRTTGDAEFLERTRSAIRATMAAYPAGWRWGDNLDRSHMALALAWLVRVEDTPEHRAWLARVTDDMLRGQQPNGALAERVNEQGGGGHFRVPASNEAYGTGETPLIQHNGDPVSDQLYTGGFALLALHEAASATGEQRWQEAGDRLARYLCHIQVRSEKHPHLDGTWFRAFDYGRWDFWASSADIGWGAWCVESGWGPSWTLAALALRQQRTSLWSLLEKVPLKQHLATVYKNMERNDGSPAPR